MRKYVGVLAGVAALCVMSWAQTPAPGQTPAPAQTPDQAPDQTQGQTPPEAPTPQATPLPAPPTAAKKQRPGIQYPRLELFAGGSYAETGLFNAGHWAGLEGWDSSLAANVTHWLGFIVEGGQYFGTSKIPPTVPEPFPTPGGQFCASSCATFNVDTREYNVLFGAQFARRRYGTWTPFGELLYGHQGARGVATPVDPSGPRVTEVGSGRALIAGGGLDRRINERFALRFKADYFQTASEFPTFAKKKQDNFRFSVGVVIRSVPKKKRRLEDETQTEP